MPEIYTIFIYFIYRTLKESKRIILNLKSLLRVQQLVKCKGQEVISLTYNFNKVTKICINQIKIYIVTDMNVCRVQSFNLIILEYNKMAMPEHDKSNGR